MYRTRNSIVIEELPFWVFVMRTVSVPSGAALCWVAEARLGVGITTNCVIADGTAGLLAVPTQVATPGPSVRLISLLFAALMIALITGIAGGIGAARPKACDDSTMVLPTTATPPAAIFCSASRRSKTVVSSEQTVVVAGRAIVDTQ